MKLNLLLSLLFFVVTSFAAIHEVKHIEHNDSASCLVCTVNNNLVSADAVSAAKNVEIFHFDAIAMANTTSYNYRKTDFNQSRAPPLAS